MLEERRTEMARPMRGVERDRLLHTFERAEARLRARIALLSKRIEEASARPESDQR